MLDRLLEEISGPEKAELWTDEALGELPQWEAIRDAARRAALAMGWSAAAPGASPDTFVGSVDSALTVVGPERGGGGAGGQE